MVSNKPTLRENDVTGDKGIELFLNEENDVDYDHFLNLMTSTNSNFSMDSSNCSENTSIESSPTIQRTETGNISTNDFDDDSESANSVGACVLLHALNQSSEDIKFRLRWHSDSFRMYLRNIIQLGERHTNAIINAT